MVMKKSKNEEEIIAKSTAVDYPNNDDECETSQLIPVAQQI